MTRARYHLATVAALVLAIILCGASWFWADHLYTTGALKLGYGIGLAGSALPSVALAGSMAWVRRARARGDEAAVVGWARPLFWLSIAFVGLMLLFPLL